MKIRINMLSQAESVKGQGVASAYREQIELIKQLDDTFELGFDDKKQEWDIFHIHSPNLRYKVKMNKKHLDIVHVHFIPSKNDGSLRLPCLTNFIFNKYVESLYKKADELVVVNPCFITDLEKLKINRDNITYIPNYVDPTRFYKLTQDAIDVIKDEYGILPNRFVVLGCGQVQTRKGFADFIEVAKKNSDMEFVWAGGFSFGRLMHGYRKNKKLLKNLPSNVHYLGIIDREDMNAFFNICDVLFMPSYMELFPMTILEACCVDKPLLLRDLELYKPILFSKYSVGNDIQEFSNMLIKLRNDVTYYEEQVTNSKFISSFYNKEAMLKVWKDYYLRVFEKWNSKKKSK